MLALTEADNGGRRPVHVGDEVELSLPENATTGFRWSPERYDEGVLEPAGATADYASPAVGSGGRAVFRFRVRGAGSTELVLKYWRHWEGPDSSLQRFTVTIDSSA